MIETAQLNFKTKLIGSDPEQFYKAGHALGEQLAGKEILIATVMQVSSARLIKAFAQALSEHKVKVTYAGEVSLDMALHAVYSHHYQYLICFINDDSRDTNIFAAHLYAQKDFLLDVGKLNYAITLHRDFIPSDLPLDTFAQIDAAGDHLRYIKSHLDLTKIPKLKIVVDSGNGIGGKSVLSILQEIEQLEVIGMNNQLTETYPHHFPNPDIAINTAQLQERVIRDGADLGISVGVEGTRVKFVDHTGNVVAAPYLTNLMIKAILAEFPGRVIAYEPSYERINLQCIEANKGTALRFELVSKQPANAMSSALAVFGFDNQDNYYFASSHNHASGIKAVLKVLEILQQGKLADLVKTTTNFAISERIGISAHYGIGFEQIRQRLLDKYLADHTEIFEETLDIEYPDWRAYFRPSTHDHQKTKFRLFIEAKDSALVAKIQAEIIDQLSDIADEYDEDLHTISRDLEKLSPREQTTKVLANFYYSWNRHIHSPTHPLYQKNWSNNPTPTRLIWDMSDAEFDKFWQANKSWIHMHLRQLDIYQHDYTLFSQLAAIHHKLNILNTQPIAYFSMEYGLADWLHIYSGGLGVLAGDVIKQASDTGLPMIGVGIFYHQGYFNQKINADGTQIAEYQEQKIADYAFEPAKNPNGDTVEVSVIIDDHLVFVRGWVVKVGRRELILLDTNYDKNDLWEDKMITAHLYGGDQDTRIRQEIVLGIGGYKLLLAMGVDPAICHMNEGHSAFVMISMAERFMRENNINFQTAIALSTERLVFTNHTLKVAGNDIFPQELAYKYLNPYAIKLGIEFPDLFALGSDASTANKFSMSIAGMKQSKIANAVSIIHSHAAENIWPDYHLKPITNGVHMPTWVARQLHQLFDCYIGEKWHDPQASVDFNRIWDIPSNYLWDTHRLLKEVLINNINGQLNTKLQPDVLTLSWFRRFATYKRPDLIVSDINRLIELVNNPTQPVQILIGGKAHPQDTLGQEVIKKIWNEVARPELKDKVIYVPGYNWRLAKLLVAGSDVWINTPQRYEEACGTSGMKASANGVLQMTTLDGWTDEVDWTGKGWALTDHSSELFYNTIANQIAPLYYNRNHENVPVEWVNQMVETMLVVISKYSSERMLNDYIKQLYLPILKGL